MQKVGPIKSRPSYIVRGKGTDPKGQQPSSGSDKKSQPSQSGSKLSPKATKIAWIVGIIVGLIFFIIIAVVLVYAAYKAFSGKATSSGGGDGAAAGTNMDMNQLKALFNMLK